MSPENPDTATNQEHKILFSTTFTGLHRYDQVVINNDIAIKIGKTNSEKTALVVVCANKTKIIHSSLSDQTITPCTKKGDFVFFPLSLARGQFATVGIYSLRTFKMEDGVSLRVEAHKALKIDRVPKRNDLRKVLSNLSSRDNEQLR